MVHTADYEYLPLRRKSNIYIFSLTVIYVRISVTELLTLYLTAKVKSSVSKRPIVLHSLLFSLISFSLIVHVAFCSIRGTILSLPQERG